MTGEVPNLHSLSPVLGLMLPLPCSRGMLKSTMGTPGSVNRVSWKVAFIQGSSKQGKACLAYTGCTAKYSLCQRSTKVSQSVWAVRLGNRGEGLPSGSYQHKGSPA